MQKQLFCSRNVECTTQRMQLQAIHRPQRKQAPLPPRQQSRHQANHPGPD